MLFEKGGISVIWLICTPAMETSLFLIHTRFRERNALKYCIALDKVLVSYEKHTLICEHIYICEHTAGEHSAL